MSNAVTIRDVAKRAGVSIATVSRVLNNTSNVKEDKRQRVEEAIRALRFTPNAIARSLHRKKTGGLGVILPYVEGEFFSEFLRSVDQTSQKNGRFLMISSSHRSKDSMVLAMKSMRARVDGLVIMAPEMDEDILEVLVALRIPAVFVNTLTESMPFETINYDNYQGGYLATEHLLKLGHRKIAMLKGPEMSFDANERLRGYREALHAYGIPLRTEWELPGDFSLEAGYEAANTLRSMHCMPTAVFGANDQSLIALTSVLRDSGLSIPKDISFVGFDDIPSARYVSPPLTSIHVPIYEMGSMSIQRIIDLEETEATTFQHTTLEVELVVRESTAPPDPSRA